jgi:hypothetical protein
MDAAAAPPYGPPLAPAVRAELPPPAAAHTAAASAGNSPPPPRSMVLRSTQPPRRTFASDQMSGATGLHAGVVLMKETSGDQDEQKMALKRVVGQAITATSPSPVSYYRQ